MSDDDLRIRRVVPDDSPEIAPLLGQLGYPSDVDAVRRRFELLLADDQIACWVVQHDEALLGLATGHLSRHVEFDDPVARLTALVVDERFRGQGLGRRLIIVFEGWAEERGAKLAALNTGDGRGSARTVYERLGWTASGRRFVKQVGR